MADLKKLNEQELSEVTGGVGPEYNFCGTTDGYCPVCGTNRVFDILKNFCNDTIHKCITCGYEDHQ